MSHTSWVMLPLALRDAVALPHIDSVGVLEALLLTLPVPLAERHCVGVMLRVPDVLPVALAQLLALPCCL
jgi:hypothetical protein